MNLFRTLLFWLLLAIAGAVLAQFLLRDPGFVQVRYLGTTVEMTLVGLALMAVAAGLALWLLWQALGWPLRLWRRRRERAARAILAEGLDALHHGRWTEAEAILMRAAQDPVFATPARIGAARAAAARGDVAAANAHLDAIATSQPAARAAPATHWRRSKSSPAPTLHHACKPCAWTPWPRSATRRARARTTRHSCRQPRRRRAERG